MTHRTRRTFLVLPVLATLGIAAAPVRGDVYLTPFAGSAAGGSTDDGKITYGGSLTTNGHYGIAGFDLDFGFTPDFLGTTGLGNNNLTSLMGSLLLIAPGRARFYAAGGLGIIKTRVEDATGFFRVDSNEFGINVGGGVIFMPGASVGLRGDVRYFRNLTDPEPDAEFDVDLGGLDFWRVTGGLVLRF